MAQTELVKKRQELTDHLLSSEKGRGLLHFLRSKREMSAQSSEKDVAEPVGVSKPKVDSLKSHLPADIGEMQKFPHMGRLEEEKLRWMAKIPETKLESGPSPARFDFEGNLLSRDAQISSHEGLYHHGEDPTAPGYTLVETFQFVRSSNVKQRVLGLRILSNIFLKTKEGILDVCLQNALIPQCLDAGIVLLLRWALDDNVQASIEAALTALCSLISNRADEAALSRVFWWQDGRHFPFLTTDRTPETGDESEIIDAEMVKLDVIKGLLRMDLLTRMGFILDNYKLSSVAISSILGILTRIARHSVESASLIVHDKYLIPLIYKHFLPKDWSNFDTDASLPCYNVPSYEAVNLIRILVSCGSNMASILEHKFNLMDLVLCYACIDLNELGNVNLNAMKLMLESLRLWSSFVEHGIGTDHFLNLYPWIATMFLRCQSLSLDTSLDFDFHFYVGLMNLLETIALLVDRQDAPENKFPCPVSWSQAYSLVPQINVCVRKWLCELTRMNTVSDPALEVVASALTFLATFYESVLNQSTVPVVSFHEEIEELCSKILFKFWESPICTSILSRLKIFSSLTDKTPTGRTRDAAGLPSVGTVKWNGRTCRAVAIGSPYNFLTAFVGLILSCNSLHRALDERLSSSILSNPKILNYLNAISTAKSDEVDWYGRFEYRFVVQLVNLALGRLGKLTNVSIFYRASCAVARRVLVGDENLLSDLFRNVLFNADFFTETSDISLTMAHLNLSDSLALPLVTKQTTDCSHSKLFRSAIESLPMQRSVYLNALNDSLTKSSKLKNGIRHVLNRDWIFLPLTNLPGNSSDERSDSETTSVVARCLQQVYLFWHSQPSCIDPTEYFSLLANVFTLRSDLFLDSTIHSYLSVLLVGLLNDERWDKCEFKDFFFNKYTTFHSFYMQLLTQYEAVSYSDALFSLFVLVPMQQRFDIKFRKEVWAERPITLRSVIIQLNQVPIPVEKYLYPLETDEGLLVSYFQDLINGSVIQRRNPFPYLIAIHHLHHYLFSNVDFSTSKVRIVKTVLRTKIADLLTHLTQYHKPNVEAALGFETFEKIPPNVEITLEKYSRIK